MAFWKEFQLRGHFDLEKPWERAFWAGHHRKDEHGSCQADALLVPLAGRTPELGTKFT